MKEIFNFTISFIIGTAIVLCVISTDFVYAEAGANSSSWVNPICSEMTDDEMRTYGDEDSCQPSQSVKSTSTYYTDVQSVGEEIRAGMVDRNQTIIVKYKMDSSAMSESGWFSDLCDEIFSYAFLHTGDPDEGDALKFSVQKYNSKASYFSSSNYTYITITVTVSYFTTLKQEQILKEEIDILKSQLNLEGKSDYETVKSIYDYICSNISYSYSSSYLKYTAYNALVNKSAVCQGYAVLFYKLALEYGIDARVIAGTGRTEAHAWNIVKIDGVYYNLDATWDAGKNQYQYFLKGSDNFPNHTANSDYSVSVFDCDYPLETADYMCTEHLWATDYATDKEATYAEAGQKSIHCTVCGLSDESTAVTIPKLTCKLAAPSTLKTNLTNYFGAAAGFDDLKITWNKVSGASGYHVKYRVKGTQKWTGKYTANRYVYLKNLSDGVRYEIRVYPYVSENGVKYISPNYKASTSVYTLKKTNITKTSKNIGNYITLKWKGISGETGYQIYRSKTKNGTYSKVKTVKLADKKYPSVKLSAKKGTTYWYKIRPYKSIGNSQYVYGPWSVKVKVKR